MIEEALECLKQHSALHPRVGVVLGTGLGGIAEELLNRVEIPYREIPHWPCPTTKGHAGTLVLGTLNELPVAVLSGRVHLYEGFMPSEVTFGIRVLAGMGARVLVLTNAAGGINPSYERGGLVLLSDHINLQGANPLVGTSDDTPEPKFLDLSEAYSGRLRDIARTVARELCIPLPEGVYAAVTGPAYETPAEIRFLQTIGADLVGMSTVPEAIIANHLGLEVLAISCVSNMAAGIRREKISHEQVLEAGVMVQETFRRFLKALLPRLCS